MLATCPGESRSRRLTGVEANIIVPRRSRPRFAFFFVLPCGGWAPVFRVLRRGLRTRWWGLREKGRRQGAGQEIKDPLRTAFRTARTKGALRAPHLVAGHCRTGLTRSGKGGLFGRERVRGAQDKPVSKWPRVEGRRRYEPMREGVRRRLRVPPTRFSSG